MQNISLKREVEDKIVLEKRKQRWKAKMNNKDELRRQMT